MDEKQTSSNSVDEYIARYPVRVQEILQNIRALFRAAAPNAQEKISYGIPTMMLNGTYLIYFAAFKKHVSVYPVPSGDAKFNAEVAKYQKGKGTLQFSLAEKIPYGLIRRVVKLRIKENQAKASMNKKQKQNPR